MLSKTVNSSKATYLTQKLDWEFWGLLKNQNTTISKQLSTRFDANV